MLFQYVLQLPLCEVCFPNTYSDYSFAEYVFLIRTPITRLRSMFSGVTRFSMNNSSHNFSLYITFSSKRFSKTILSFLQESLHYGSSKRKCIKRLIFHKSLDAFFNYRFFSNVPSIRYQLLFVLNEHLKTIYK